MAKQNGELKIERGIPIPHDGQRGKGYTAAIRKLKKGESVLLPLHITSARSLTVQANLVADDFVRRTENGGTRVWRIK